MWGNPFLCFTKCRAKPNQINQSLSNPLTLEKSIPIFVFEKIAFKVEARASKSMTIAIKKLHLDQDVKILEHQRPANRFESAGQPATRWQSPNTTAASLRQSPNTTVAPPRPTPAPRATAPRQLAYSPR